ncbi:MAG: hypothetical protein IJV35_01505 [Neisseriaceae bacterium]|nr:hypothetical protein [Neisseriaceae bacterium]
MSNEQLFSFALRQNGLFLDNASIFLSGCLKKIEALSKKTTVKPQGLT